jgi:hypothetical protein
MGTNDPDRIDFDTHNISSLDKAVFEVDTRAASPKIEDSDKGYVDPKEERAFVSRQTRVQKEARLTDQYPGLEVGSMVSHYRFLGLYVQVY